MSHPLCGDCGRKLKLIEAGAQPMRADPPDTTAEPEPQPYLFRCPIDHTLWNLGGDKVLTKWIV